MKPASHQRKGDTSRWVSIALPKTRSTALSRNARIFKRCVLLACLLVAFSSPLKAEEKSSVTTAELQLEPVIVVEPNTSMISASHTGDGEVVMTAGFSVEANTKRVDMFVETTAFYLNGDTASPDVSPIPLLESAGVQIDPEGASVINGSNPANFAGNGDPIEGYASNKTTMLTFESGGLVFNHSTDVTVTWDQNEPLKPAGKYYAKVKLTCINTFPE